jgi:hypothetical protein
MFARLEEFRFARWVKSLNRGTQILLSLTLVGALNYAAAKHYERWDLTPDRHFSLSPETLAYLQQKVPHTADAPLQIISILPEDTSDSTQVSNKQIDRLLDEYGEAGKRAGIPLEINPRPGDPGNHLALNPVVETARYEDLLRLGIPQYTRILVMRGEHFHALNNADLYDTKTTADGQPTPTGFNGENAITSAILDVIQTEPDEICFTQGHGELDFSSTDQTFGLSNLKEFLTKRNFALKGINLLGETADVPEKAKLVVIADPNSQFNEEEIVKLRKYLGQRNGRVLIFMDPGRNAGLEGLLHDWGLYSTNRLVVEDAAHSTADYGTILDPSEHPSPNPMVRFAAMSNHQITLLFGPTRPVEVDQTTPGEQQQVTQLLFTSKGATVFKDWSGPNGPVSTPQEDFVGSVSVAALSEQHANGTADLPGGRLMVVGDAFVLTNKYSGQLGNPDLLLNCFNYLASRDNLLNIHPRLPVQSKLEISNAHYVGLTWRLGLLPAVVALFGLVVFWVRNRT